MKKFLSLILSLVMVLGVSTVTFADVVADNGDVSSVDLAKIYKLANNGVKNPAETFNFTVTNESVSDSQYTFDGANGSEIMPSISPNTYEISFTEGEAALAGDKNTTAIALPTYNHVGIFTYKITETASNTAGVEYDAKPIYLKVTVTEENGQKVRHVVFHYGTVNGSKTEGITNIYSASSLDIKKEVTGNMGEKDRYFKVDVTLNAPTEITDTATVVKPVKSTISITGGSNSNNPTTVKFADGENTKTITLLLKDDETITLGNLPVGVTYTVKEADYTTDANGKYDKPKYNDVEDTQKQGITGTVDKDNKEVKITNNRGRDVDTGIFVDNLPYIMILAVVVVGGGAFIIKRRMASNNN